VTPRRGISVINRLEGHQPWIKTVLVKKGRRLRWKRAAPFPSDGTANIVGAGRSLKLIPTEDNSFFSFKAAKFKRPSYLLSRRRAGINFHNGQGLSRPQNHGRGRPSGSHLEEAALKEIVTRPKSPFILLEA